VLFRSVYLGEHIYLDTQTAIKVLYTQLVGQDVEQFRQEAQTIAHMEHPHIVRLLDFGVEGTTPYLIMSYAPNGTMRERYPKGTRLPLEQVVFYVKQISQALQYAHERRIIHRDIKPENMLFGPDDQVVLSDFGIALVTQSSRYQQPNDMAGTIAYMAPEQIEAHPRPASDQYSLGIVVYEWLRGERPFHGSFTEIAVKQQLVAPPSLREKVPSLSAGVEQVVMTALAKDPKARFGNIRAFATALEQASQSVKDAPSSQLDIAVPSTPQDASTVPIPPTQSVPESSQAGMKQEPPILKAPEVLRGSGEGQVEVPPQVHSDSPSLNTDEKETVLPPSYEEVLDVASSGISSLTGDSASLDAIAAHSEPSHSSTNSPVSSAPMSTESPSSSPFSPSTSSRMLNAPQSQAGAHDSSKTGPSGTEISTSKTSHEKVKPWSLGKRQIIAMLIGIVIFSVVDYLIKALILSAEGSRSSQLYILLLVNPLIWNVRWAYILDSLALVVPLFFATKFGPWVGFAVALLGAMIGDILSKTIFIFFVSNWYSYAGIALLGFLSGLAFLRTQGRYNTRRNIATALVTSFIGSLVYGLFYMLGVSNTTSYFSSYFYVYYLPAVLANIIALILLPIFLIISNKIEMRNASAT
jgi:serine/threonine protein kinase